MMKKLVLLVALVVGMLGLNKGDVFAFESTIPSDSDNFQYGACASTFICSSGSVVDGVIPNITTGLCSDGWTPVCFYDSEGNYDANAVNCSCRKLQVEEDDPVNHTNNACACEGMQVIADECDSGTTPHCSTNSNINNLSNCLCLTDEAFQSEESVTGHTYQIGESMVSTTHVYDPTCGDNGISTPFGCIPYDASGFAAKFIQILFGIGGGIAFLLMVYGFILVATSSGDEKKLQAAKETITSAITGLLVSIFALFLFRLIAINILKIPGISSDGTMSGVDVNNYYRENGTTIHTTTITNPDGTTTETEHGGGGGGF